MRFIGLLIAIAVSFGFARAQAQEGAKVVVLDFDGGDTGLGDEERSGMSDRLSDGKYDVIRRDEFKSALASHESKTGKPCKDDKCMMQVARSLGAQGAVRPKVKRDGRGCSVSLGMLGGGGEQVAGSTLKNKCSMKSMAIAMDWAMVEMTYKMGKDKPLLDQAADLPTAEEVEEAKRRAEAAAAAAKADLSDADVDDDQPEEGEEQQVDREAEERAKRMEAEAARKYGL